MSFFEFKEMQSNEPGLKMTIFLNYVPYFTVETIKMGPKICQFELGVIF